MADMNDVVSQSKHAMGKLYKEHAPLMDGFRGLSKAAMADGALSRKQKELIAAALSVTSGCDRCIAHHVRGCLDNGATRQEVLEAAGVAVLIGGGPALMCAESVLQALDDFGAT